ncbi:hypothetical protein NXH64_13490 [Butyrivibrio fibrisolvens]|uniref:hypothetical protein n=1 Tax=Pseudobutyrivibrio ruminis TaxID=46206 RepID=UPI000425809C|nr:hypothetical protein [Pseudobutyrivibrio ruminis]MDC7280510.1 hypothetical protein [Butyrivibrio fibrisolvens]
MRNLKTIIKNITICLVAVVCMVANYTMVADATEVIDGSAVAIIEIESYNVEGGMIEAGKNITVNLTLHNTSNSSNATSIIMTMSNATGSVLPAYGNSNQVYVGTISAGKKKEVSVPLTIGETYMGGAVDLSCQFDYLTSGARMNNVATIAIPVSGGSTLGVKSIDVNTHAIVNGKSLLSCSYINQSSSNITDAKLIIDGNVSSASKEISLDTVYAGKTYTQDFYVTFKEPGNQAINVTLQYTDVDGNLKTTDLGKFEVSVSKESVSEENADSISGVIGIAGKIVALIVLVIAAVSIVTFIKKR